MSQPRAGASDVPRQANSAIVQALSTIVITQSLRYWLLGAWALAMTTCLHPRVVVSWFAVATAVGLARGSFERALARRVKLSVGRELTAIATLTSIVWAAAPWLVWRSAAPAASMIAFTMLFSGYLLVLTQFRHLPWRAATVSAPYGAVLIYEMSGLVGAPTFWPLISAVGVAGSAFLTNIFFSGVHRAQIEAFQFEQSRLIQELEAARDHADDVSRAKSAFLAMISHELRTPMNGVLGAAQMLDEAGLSSEQKAFVSMIRGSADTLRGLLDDVLDISKIEANRLELEAIRFELPPLIERVVAMWRLQAQSKGLGFGLRIAPDVPLAIIGDPTRLAQVVHNLCSNAVKFTTTGEIFVDVMRSGVSRSGDGLRIAVRDTGPGIAKEDQARLFIAFSQLDASSTRKFGGTGLGLAISRRLARLMGGDLTVSSQARHGAEFFFDFEAPSATASEPLDTPREVEVEPLRPLRILVAEDHPINQQILRLWLEGQGHECLLAANGQEALDAAAIHQFDVALMDVNMPVLDGLGAVRRLRAQPGRNARAPVIMLSASAREEDHAAGLAAGADRYLTKPIDFVELARALAEAGRRDANLGRSRPQPSSM